MSEGVRYEPEDKPSLPIAIGAGAQGAMVAAPQIALMVAIVARSAGQPESYIGWGVFAALLVAGAMTILQAARVGRFGSGHNLMMGTSGAFIAVCAAAMATGGPAMMGSLVAASSLLQFAVAWRLAPFRRIFTPVTLGTVIMLMPVPIMPIAFDTLRDAPAGTSPLGAPAVAAATLAVVGAVSLRVPSRWRLWSIAAGIVAGCAVAAMFGMYDWQSVRDAAWFGVPMWAPPGLSLTFDYQFWALLPAFLVVAIIGAVETVGDGVAIQRASRREPRATDFRVAQGALNVVWLGNLLSGVAGTLPNTTYSSSVSLAEATAVAARRAGVVAESSLYHSPSFRRFWRR